MKKQRINKFICVTLVFCTLLFSVTGCLKNTGSEQNSTVQGSQGAASSETTSKDVRLSIAQRGCELAKHEVIDNPGFYEINCKQYLENLDWLYTILIYEEQLAILYGDDNMGFYLALLDPYSLTVTGPVSLDESAGYNPYLYTDTQGRLLLYNEEQKLVTYYNQSLEAEKEVPIDEVTIDNILFSEDGDYAYYYDSSQQNIIQYDIPNKTKQQLYHLSAANTDYCFMDGIIQNRYLAISYSPDIETTIYEIVDLQEGEVLYSNSSSIHNIMGCGDNYSLLYSMDGVEEILCGSQNEETHILSLPDIKEYNNFDRTTYADSLISYVTNVNIPEAQNTSIIFRGYDLTSGQMKHSKAFVMEKETECFVTTTCYNCNKDYMVFMTSFEQPVLFVWDLLDADSQVNDDTSYFRSIPDLSTPDTAQLLALNERAKTMSQHYGVDIRIGDELDTCPVLDYSYTKIYNPIRIEQTLNILEKELSKYPDGMLAQIDDDIGDRIQIYLSGKILGIADGTISDSRGIENTVDGITFVVLNITDIQELDRTLHHEIFHAIEGHMDYAGYYFDYDRWEALNPQGFSYDYDYIQNEENTDWDYVMSDETGGYFIDIYSKSFPHEDRARIMEYAMTEKEYNSGAFSYDGIAKKHAYICEQLRLAFQTEGWPEQTVWEQVLQGE
ncbi:MAG: hypothetical protein ACI4F4_02140 [Lachnospiraceae bacterium]